MINLKNKWLVSIASIALTAFIWSAISADTSVSSNSFQRYTVGGTEIYELDKEGDLEIQGDFQADQLTSSEGLKLGDAPSSPTLPVVGTADDFSVKVPFYNQSGSTLALGSVILTTSGTVTSNGLAGTAAAVLATTTVMGVLDASCTSGAVCFMSVSGFAAVLTTGTVKIGDILVSTSGSNGAGAAGYAGVTTGTQVVGTVIGKALEVGTSSGDLIMIKLAD